MPERLDSDLENEEAATNDLPRSFQAIIADRSSSKGTLAIAVALSLMA